jgi:hypothetical protein
VNEVRAKLAQPYETNHRTLTKDGIQNVKDVHESAFSFWNIIAPTDLDAYWSDRQTHQIDLANFVESYSKALALDMSWWYWNVREWGCKWDACEVDVMEDIKIREELTIGYKFDTPWSPPLEAMEKLAKQYPDLIVNIEYEEEQGWGGELTWQGVNVLDSKDWDIPNSHAELVLHKGYCHQCGDGFNVSNSEYWFDDCPTPEVEKVEEERLDTVSSVEVSVIVSE